MPLLTKQPTRLMLRRSSAYRIDVLTFLLVVMQCYFNVSIASRSHCTPNGVPNGLGCFVLPTLLPAGAQQLLFTIVHYELLCNLQPLMERRGLDCFVEKDLLMKKLSDLARLVPRRLPAYRKGLSYHVFASVFSAKQSIFVFVLAPRCISVVSVMQCNA